MGKAVGRLRAATGDGLDGPEWLTVLVQLHQPKRSRQCKHKHKQLPQRALLARRGLVARGRNGWKAPSNHPRPNNDRHFLQITKPSLEPHYGPSFLDEAHPSHQIPFDAGRAARGVFWAPPTASRHNGQKRRHPMRRPDQPV